MFLCNNPKTPMSGRRAMIDRECERNAPGVSSTEGSAHSLILEIRDRLCGPNPASKMRHYRV